MVDIIDSQKISDGYHTFEELYKHRHLLFIALSNLVHFKSWKSKKHSNNDSNPMFEGYFIAGINFKKGEQIRYHIPLEYFDMLKCEELPEAVEWDGSNSNDVLERIKEHFITK